jgi:lysophospholipase L1-like esterase
MLKTIVKNTLKALFWLLLFMVVAIGVAGTSSVLLTLAMYFLMWFTATRLNNKLTGNQNKRSNYHLLITTLVLSLLACELTLKYVVKLNLSYSEANGRWLYDSQYKQLVWQNITRKYIYKTTAPLVYANDPNTSQTLVTPDFTFKQTYNSLGLRGEEPKKDSSLYNIIGLGDSFTEGVGAPADSTWPLLFEAICRQKFTQSVQVINAGKSNSDPFMELILLKDRLLQYKPRMVIICVNQSDLSDVISRGGHERFLNTNLFKTPGPWWEFFYSYSYIFRAIAKAVFNVDVNLLTPEQLTRQKALANAEIATCLTEDFKALAAKYHFKPVVILHPMQWELDDKIFELKPLATALSHDSSFTVINLYEDYKQQINNGKLKSKAIYWPTDRHHNAKGYNLWARILSEKITIDAN